MKLLAFQVSSPLFPELGSEVVFGTDMEDAVQASRHWTSGDWEQGGVSFEVQRLPDFDEYAPGPVPLSKLLEAGWSLTALDLGDDVLEFIRKREGR